MLSDEALYERLIEGDLDAFDQLYERYERPLFGFICRHLADPDDGQDVLHEAFMAVLRERDKGRPARSFRAWLYQVARNLCLNRLRARKRGARAAEAMARIPTEPNEGPDSALARHQASIALRNAVDRLPSRLGELYSLRAGGLSYEELSLVLEIPLGTVKSRMHELVGLLREEMKT